MILGELMEGADRFARHQAKIRRALDDLGFPQAIDRPVKPPATEVLEKESLASAIGTLGLHNVVAGIKQAQHLRDQGWRMFAIAVHHDDRIGVAGIKSSAQRGLVPEIAGEMDGANPGIRSRQLGQHRLRIVARAVVDVEKTKRVWQSRGCFCQASVESMEGIALIEDGNHNVHCARRSHGCELVGAIIYRHRISTWFDRGNLMVGRRLRTNRVFALVLHAIDYMHESPER